MVSKTVSKDRLESNLWGIVTGPNVLHHRDGNESRAYASIASKIEIEFGWDRWCEIAVLIADEVLREKD